MEEVKEKFVDFEKYCPECEYKNNKETEDPCPDCLNEPVNWGSQKPTQFKN